MIDATCPKCSSDSTVRRGAAFYVLLVLGLCSFVTLAGLIIWPLFILGPIVAVIVAPIAGLVMRGRWECRRCRKSFRPDRAQPHAG